jgi:hypothetical protein
MLLSGENVGETRTCSEIAVATARRGVLRAVAVSNFQVMMRSIFTVGDGVTAAMRTRESYIYFEGARVGISGGSLVNTLKAERNCQNYHVDRRSTVR